MHNDNDEVGYEKHPRSGLIPYLVTPGKDISYLMMISSDPKFGGPRPMISKGKIENGETTLSCAIREAEEELGYKQRNGRGEPILVWEGRTQLYSCAYELTVYGIEIMDRYDFDKWCEETEYTEWLTLEEFRKHGRRDHLKYVELLEAKAKNYHEPYSFT